MASTAYSRPSKPPGPSGGDRRGAPRLAKELGRIESKKLGIGLVAGCCLALLTYLSFARLFAIYSPVFESTSLVMKNEPPATTTISVPVEQKSGGGEEQDDGGKEDVTDPEADPTVPNLAEQEIATEQKKNEHAKPSGAGAGAGAGGDGAKITCDENGVDEGFPYARPPVCELSGDIRISPKDKTMYLVNPSGAGPFDANGEKRIRPFARKDDFLLPGVVEVTIKSVPSPDALRAGGGLLRGRVHGQLLPRQHGRAHPALPHGVAPARGGAAAGHQLQAVVGAQVRARAARALQPRGHQLRRRGPPERALLPRGVPRDVPRPGPHHRAAPDPQPAQPHHGRLQPLPPPRLRAAARRAHPARGGHGRQAHDAHHRAQGHAEAAQPRRGARAQRGARLRGHRRRGQRRRRARLRRARQRRRRPARRARRRDHQPDLPPHGRRAPADRALGEDGLDGHQLLRPARAGHAPALRRVLRQRGGDHHQGQVPARPPHFHQPHRHPRPGVAGHRRDHHEAGRQGQHHKVQALPPQGARRAAAVAVIKAHSLLSADLISVRFLLSSIHRYSLETETIWVGGHGRSMMMRYRGAFIHFWFF